MAFMSQVDLAQYMNQIQQNPAFTQGQGQDQQTQQAAPQPRPAPKKKGRSYKRTKARLV